MTEGRVVLITGGAGGMGRAIAARFIQADEAVVLSDLTAQALTAAAEAEAVSGVADTDARHGGIDLLVTAAGVWVEGRRATR